MDAGRRRRGRETHGVRGPNRGDGRAFLSCISINYKNGIIWDISRRERKTIPATEGGRCARAIRNRVRVGRSEHARTVPRGRRESSRGGAAASGDGARAVDARPPFGATGVGESGEAPAKGSERVRRGCQMVNTRESGGRFAKTESLTNDSFSKKRIGRARRRTSRRARSERDRCRSVFVQSGKRPRANATVRGGVPGQCLCFTASPFDKLRVRPKSAPHAELVEAWGQIEALPVPAPPCQGPGQVLFSAPSSPLTPA
jgi:hypothetical protein